MMPVVLWTDAMIFLLLATILAGAWHIRKWPHLMLPWQRVATSRMGMVSLLILLLFMLVGLLDSLHYRIALPEKNNGQTVYSAEVVSAFDALASGLKSRTEKTYSAPMAVYLYAKESMETPEGKILRDYPRLRFGGVHLSDVGRDWLGDVVQKAARGALAGLLLGVLLIAAIWILFLRQRGDQLPLSKVADNPRKALLITTLLLAAFFGAVSNLAASYHV
ncbi:MAG: ABC transporter permease, partial [Candidatus Nitrotoga sp.]